MKKKAIGTLIISAALVLSLSACGSSSNKNAANNNTANNNNNATAPAQGGEKDITVTASNFQFNPAEIHVKKGDKVKITLTNKEGTHGLAINDYNVNIQGDGSATFTADKAGKFPFACSVMCGAGHADMKGTLVVE